MELKLNECLFCSFRASVASVTSQRRACIILEPNTSVFGEMDRDCTGSCDHPEKSQNEMTSVTE